MKWKDAFRTIVAAACLGLLFTAPVLAAEDVSPTAKAKSAKKASVTVAVYYLHGNARCYSCNLIEAQAKEAVETGFAKDLKKGLVTFTAVNVDTPGNEHYLQDFKVGAKSVVVVRSVGGAQKSFRSLDKVWRLLRDKPAFIDYVQKNVKAAKEGA